MEVILLLPSLVVLNALKSGHHPARCTTDGLKPFLQTRAPALFMRRKLALVTGFPFGSSPRATGNKIPFHALQRPWLCSCRSWEDFSPTFQLSQTKGRIRRVICSWRPDLIELVKQETLMRSSVGKIDKQETCSVLTKGEHGPDSSKTSTNLKIVPVFPDMLNEASQLHPTMAVMKPRVLALPVLAVQSGPRLFSSKPRRPASGLLLGWWGGGQGGLG